MKYYTVIFPIPYFVGQGNLPLYHNQTIRHENLIAYLILRRSKQVIWNEAVKIILLTSSSSSRRMKSGFNQRSLDHHVIYLLPIFTLCVYIQWVHRRKKQILPDYFWTEIFYFRQHTFHNNLACWSENYNLVRQGSRKEDSLEKCFVFSYKKDFYWQINSNNQK